MDWNQFLGNLEKALTIVVIIGGGMWSYLKLYKGRIFRYRFELDTDGRMISKDNVKFVIVTLKLKNTALSPVNVSEVALDPEDSVLQVFACEAKSYEAELGSVKWVPISSHLIFTAHKWIGIDEVIKEQILIPLPPKEYIALKLVARILSKRTEWRDEKIIGGYSVDKSNVPPEPTPNNSFNPSPR